MSMVDQVNTPKQSNELGKNMFIATCGMLIIWLMSMLLCWGLVGAIAGTVTERLWYLVHFIAATVGIAAFIFFLFKGEYLLNKIKGNQ